MQPYSTSLRQMCTRTDLHNCREVLPASSSTAGLQLFFVHLFSSFNLTRNSLTVMVCTQNLYNKCVLVDLILLLLGAPYPLSASPCLSNLVKQALDKYLLNEIMNQHQLNIRCYCNNWLGQTDTWIPCGTLWQHWNVTGSMEVWQRANCGWIWAKEGEGGSGKN